MRFVYKIIGVLSICLFVLSCNSNKYESPKGYDFNQYSSMALPNSLKYVTGIAYTDKSMSFLYAVAYDKLNVYCYYPGNRVLVSTKVGVYGNYEDLCISNKHIVILEKTGNVITFPIKEMGKKYPDSLKVFNVMLPKGAFNVMFSDSSRNRVYVLGNPSYDSTNVHGYEFKCEPNGDLERFGHFILSVKEINQNLNGEKIDGFEPSGLARNPRTKEWYIVSDKRKMMIVANSSWGVKAVFKLNKSIFTRSRGMAFDAEFNLYIANQGSTIERSRVVRYAFDSTRAIVDELKE